MRMTLGIKPAPIPCILCGPGFPPDKTGELFGSTATIFTSGFFFLSPRPVPVIVPPVPTDDTNISTFPSKSSQISSAVVTSWIFGFASFSNCCGIKTLPYSCSSLWASSIAPLIPSLPGVRRISAPSAVTIFLLSTLMVSGIIRIR